MKLIKPTLVLLQCLLLLTGNLVAQVDKNKKKLIDYQSIDASYIVGAQVFNDNFIYNPGYSFTGSYGVFINKNLAIGLGSGYKAFENETFLPVYGEILGYKKNKKNIPFVKMQIGYAHAWSKNQAELTGYTFKGGLFISAGMGRKIAINDKLSVMLHWSYQHQFAKMQYTIFNSTSHTEILNYDMIVISLGLIKN